MDRQIEKFLKGLESDCELIKLVHLILIYPG